MADRFSRRVCEHRPIGGGVPVGAESQSRQYCPTHNIKRLAKYDRKWRAGFVASANCCGTPSRRKRVWSRSYRFGNMLWLDVSH